VFSFILQYNTIQVNCHGMPHQQRFIKTWKILCRIDRSHSSDGSST